MTRPMHTFKEKNMPRVMESPVRAWIRAQKSSCLSLPVSYSKNEAGAEVLSHPRALERTSEFSDSLITPLRNGEIPQGYSYLSSPNRRTIRTTRTPATTATRMSARHRAIGITSFLSVVRCAPPYQFHIAPAASRRQAARGKA